MKITDPDKARKNRIAIYHYLFDLLFFDGYDTTHLPLRHRKTLLRKMLKFRSPLRFIAHRAQKGEKFYKEACKAGLEGLTAKNAKSNYAHTRSRDWLKFKCVNEQEFVIGGYTDPRGSRVGFGALLVGYYKGNQLKYAGMVGTGYDDKLLRELGKKLRSIEEDDPPFSKNSLPKKNVHWVRPRLVGQVGFTEWTGDGKLRHPRFKGLRRDKKPREVVREKQ
jgi:DNA ligase D-like protein (predicted ligase)